MPGNTNTPTAGGGVDLSNRGVDPAATRGGSSPLAAAAGPPKPKRPLNKSIRPCSLSQQRLDAARGNPPAHFHKNLDHDAGGGVDASLWGQFLDALKAVDAVGNVRLLAEVPAGPRKWVNPLCGWAVDSEVSDPCPHKIPDPPALDSAEAAAEMVELFWHALLRDVPFADWDGHPDVAAAAAELGGLPLYIKRAGDVNAPPSAAGNGYVAKPLDHATLFRGGDLFVGDDAREKVGPFVSQFLWRDIPYGSLTISQQQMHAEAGVDYMTDAAEWRAVQNGEARDPMQHLVGRHDAADRRLILTMRDLATYVHFDQLYEAYLNAALILMGEGYPLNVGNPYGRHCDLYGTGMAGTNGSAGSDEEPIGDNQIGFGTFGGPHILSLVTEVATRALKTVWRQKWTHLRLRPEAYAGLLHHGGQGVSPGTFGTAGEAVLTASITGNGAIGRMSARNKGGAAFNYLLPQAFPEGSPTHPSYGAGHACVAGACVTILKAFFDAAAAIQNADDPRGRRQNASAVHRRRRGADDGRLRTRQARGEHRRRPRHGRGSLPQRLHAEPAAGPAGGGRRAVPPVPRLRRGVLLPLRQLRRRDRGRRGRGRRLHPARRRQDADPGGQQQRPAQAGQRPRPGRPHPAEGGLGHRGGAAGGGVSYQSSQQLRAGRHDVGRPVFIGPSPPAA